MAERAFAVGAQGVVSKGDAAADLLKAVLLASRGRSYISPVFAAHADRRDFEDLSPKQLAVLRLLAQGLERKQIAERMGIGEETVKSHLAEVRRKLGARTSRAGRRDRPDQLALRLRERRRRAAALSAGSSSSAAVASLDVLDGVDRLELVDLGAAVLPVRRDAHVRAELVLGLVDREALRRRVGELEQRAARRAQVDAEEVAAVLDVGDVGVAEADDVVLDAQLVLGRADVERVVVDRALAEVPRALRQVGLLDELEDLAVAVAGRACTGGARPRRRSCSALNASRRKSSIGSGSRTEVVVP